MNPSRDIDRLIEIMAALRTPVTGCPWDLQQDFASIAPYAIEEAHEVADAIARHDMDDLVDELGDLLLQVFFHAQMAREAEKFDFGDVVEAITAKMIRRHPHVFGDAGARDAGEVRKSWEEIKAAEKRERGKSGSRLDSRLDDVPASLPPLLRAVKLQKRASRIGFDWNDPRAVLDKIEEETGEIREAVESGGDRAELTAEIGDLLFAVCNLARHLDVSPEQAAIAANAKFERRFRAVEARYDAAGDPAPSLETMDGWWDEAKASER
ncbi:MAG: nucleoside triphosphate pyrophosphohydrolase [Flavobacteriaceae bacterium]